MPPLNKIAGVIPCLEVSKVIITNTRIGFDEKPKTSRNSQSEFLIGKQKLGEIGNSSEDVAFLQVIETSPAKNFSGAGEVSCNLRKAGSTLT